MSRKHEAITGTIYALIILTLIVDSTNAIASAKNAILICLETVIPSLFPMCILTNLMIDIVLGKTLHPLSFIRKICKLPKGGESIFVLGLLGGYPLGAKLIAQGYNRNALSKQQAKRMLYFCSNAGPAFLFGLCTPLFTKQNATLALWSVHICSAVLLSLMLPGENGQSVKLPQQHRTTQSILYDGIKTMGVVCGWIILFRVLLRFLERWIIFAFPAPVSAVIKCLVELSTGILDLHIVRNEQIRFIICAVALSFGGLCIMLQTATITSGLAFKSYVCGKIMHALISYIMALLTCQLLYSNGKLSILSPFVPILVILITIIFQKGMEFFISIIYNIKNKPARSLLCCSAKK